MASAHTSPKVDVVYESCYRLLQRCIRNNRSAYLRMDPFIMKLMLTNLCKLTINSHGKSKLIIPPKIFTDDETDFLRLLRQTYRRVICMKSKQKIPSTYEIEPTPVTNGLITPEKRKRGRKSEKKDKTVEKDHSGAKPNKSVYRSNNSYNDVIVLIPFSNPDLKVDTMESKDNKSDPHAVEDQGSSLKIKISTSKVKVATSGVQISSSTTTLKVSGQKRTIVIEDSKLPPKKRSCHKIILNLS